MNALARAVLVAGALALAGMTACEKEPDPATIHREAGDKHLGSNEFKQAAEAYGKSLEIDPKQEKVWEKKAYAHLQAGEMDEADAAILKTVDFKPDTQKKAEVYRNLGGMYMQKASVEKAEKYFNEAVKIDPQDVDSLTWLGEIYSQRGGARSMTAEVVPEHLEKALEYYDKAIAIKPDVPTPYLNKRIVMNRYMDYERKQKEAAEQEAQDSGADKEKAEAAKARAAEHQAHIDEYKAKFDELSKKFSEVQKKAKQQQK